MDRLRSRDNAFCVTGEVPMVTSTGRNGEKLPCKGLIGILGMVVFRSYNLKNAQIVPDHDTADTLTLP